jgi:hypothetical protein
MSLGSSCRSLGVAFTNTLKATDKMGRHFHPASASRKEITFPIDIINRKNPPERLTRVQKSLKPISKYFDIGFSGC